MKKDYLKYFEEKLESMNDPRERRSFLNSMFMSLMGHNFKEVSDLNNPVLLNSPHNSPLKVQREYVFKAAELLMRFGLEKKGQEVIKSYMEPHFSSGNENYISRNRTRPYDRLIGILYNEVFLPRTFGHTIEVEVPLNRSYATGFLISSNPMSAQEAEKLYSIKNPNPGPPSSIGIGLPLVKRIIEGEHIKDLPGSLGIPNPESTTEAIKFVYGKVI